MLWIILIISIFILNETPRMLLLNKFVNNQTYIWSMNLLFLLSSGLLLIGYIKSGKIKYKVIYIIIIIFGLLFINTLFGNITLKILILFTSTYIIPLLLISLKLENTKKISEVFLKIFNVIIILLTIYGIIDYFTKGALQLFIANNLAYGEFQSLIYNEHTLVYRMYSFLGHPLENAKLYLIYYIFNNVYNKKNKKLFNKYIFLIITAIGLILSGSKTALVLACFLFIFFNGIKSKRWMYYTLMIISFIIIFNTSMFQNNLLKRFQIGIQYNDISTGRNDLLKEVIRLGIEPNYIICGGNGYSRQITVNAMTGADNFEYAPIMISYDYGVIETSLIYVLIFIYPLIIFVRNKDFYILFNYLVLFLYVNGNNGLASLGSDSMGQICFVVMLLINMSQSSKEVTVSNIRMDLFSEAGGKEEDDNKG